MSRPNRIEFHDLHASDDDFVRDVVAGLGRRPASIPPKYFYDAEGSRLFEEITRLPEYYLTRTEVGLLERHAADIARRVGSGSLLVEPGGGSCTKVHILLQGLEPRAYVPIDISREHLHGAAQDLAAQFPWLEIHAACADFTRGMTMPPTAPEGPRLAFFPGSSIGNFTPRESVQFLQSIAALVGAGGFLLIGVDLKKDRRILLAAYDDAAGVTARFNLNLLQRINRELGGDFDLDHWRHRALYNEADGRIEMHLVSSCTQTVHLSGRAFEFSEGETIHSENSYKYSIEEFIALATQAGFTVQEVWVDDDRLFSVHLFRVQP